MSKVKYIFGGYGCNNIGDEAIYQGAKMIYPNLRQIYINVSKEPDAVWYADLLTGKAKFENADELIIGGGGIAHCKGAVEDYYKMAVLAKEQGLRVSIQRVGLEGVQDSFSNELSYLLTVADSISVRTSRSKTIARKLGFEMVKVERDFAYELGQELIKSQRKTKTIGVILNHMKDEELPTVAKHLKALLKHANLDFITHSEAYVDAQNNDFITAHKLLPMLDLWQDNGKNLDKVMIIPMHRVKLTRIYYRHSHGIYSRRYHGCIFADLDGIPLISINGDKKVQAFYKDNTSDKNIHIQTDSEERALERLEEWVKQL